MVTKRTVDRCLCIGFHWLSMVMLVGLFLTGNMLAWMGQSPVRMQLGEMQVWMMVGLLGVTFGRLGWALFAPRASQLGWSQRLMITAVVVAVIGGLGVWLLLVPAVKEQAFFWQMCLTLIVAHLIGVFYYQDRVSHKKPAFRV